MPTSPVPSSFGTFIRNQRRYLAKLTGDERRLLFSYFCFSLAAPIFITFTNTYLWRGSENLDTLVLYNGGMYLGVTLGFIANAVLMRTTSAKHLYSISCFLQAIVPLALVVSGVDASSNLILFGITFGLGTGLYWANRNTFTQAATKSSNRFSFMSLEYALNTFAGIFMPAIIGWMLANASETFLGTTQHAYEAAMAFGFIILAVSGALAWNLDIHADDLRPRGLFIPQATKLWWRLRGMEFVSGMLGGIEVVLPLFIILTFIGLEDAVGLLASVAAILSGIVMYFAGKRTRKDYRKIFALWFCVTLIGSIIFFSLFGPLGALIYTLCLGLVKSFRWAPFVATMYDVVDRDSVKTGRSKATYLMDREYFLNAGRITSLAAISGVTLLAPEHVVQISLIVGVILQAWAILIAISLSGK